jgi:hypothetical protein
MCEDLIWVIHRLNHIIQLEFPLVAKCFTLEPIANNLKVKTHYGDPFCVITFYYFFWMVILQKSFTMFFHIMVKHNRKKF